MGTQSSSYAIIHNAHTCINGCTGSGKSVLINRFIYDLVTNYSRNEVNLYIIDPKRIDYIKYSKLSHLKARADNARDWTKLLEKLVSEMNSRYNYMMPKCLDEYPGKHIYLIIDELPQVLQSKHCTDLLDELLRLGRAARIHVVTASQDSSRSTGTPARLARNFTCQIGLHCRDKVASRQAIGTTGCELLPLYGYAYIYTPADLQPQLTKIEKVTSEQLKKITVMH